jgi:hypothetical protein
MSLDFSDEVPRRSRVEIAGSSVLRVAMLFSSIAVAVALLASQVLDNSLSGYSARSGAIGLDYTATGAIGSGNRYTIRRSVLQPSPTSVCILRDNGTRSGEC